MKITSTQLLAGTTTAIGRSVLRNDFKFSSLKGGLLWAAANLVMRETTDIWGKSYEDKSTDVSGLLNF
jgi:hypothetical protein